MIQPVYTKGYNQGLIELFITTGNDQIFLIANERYSNVDPSQNPISPVNQTLTIQSFSNTNLEMIDSISLTTSQQIKKLADFTFSDNDQRVLSAILVDNLMVLPLTRQIQYISASQMIFFVRTYKNNPV